MTVYICLYILIPCIITYIFFFFNDTATTEIYTLSLHDALPISERWHGPTDGVRGWCVMRISVLVLLAVVGARSEEHTSELQSQSNLVCRLLLEKKKKQNKNDTSKA